MNTNSIYSNVLENMFDKMHSYQKADNTEIDFAGQPFNKLIQSASLAKAFIFDFYGTLVEDDVTVPEMWELLNELGYNSGPELQAVFEPDAFDGCITPNFHSSPNHDNWNRANWNQFVRLSGVPDDLINSTLTYLLERQNEFRAKPVPRAISIIEFLRARNMKIGLCSNWESPICTHLEHCCLPAFDAISISADVGARKPHSAIFNDICLRLKVNPNEAVFIGDNWSADIVGALRSDLIPVWIRHGRASRGVPHLVAEFDTLADFEGFLRRWL